MEFIDEKPVVANRVRFSKRSEIPEDLVNEVRDGNTVVWLVRSECLAPSYHPLSAGSEERYRLNVQNVQSARPLTGVLREQAIAYLDHGGDQAYLVTGEDRLPGFDVPAYHPELEEAAAVREYLASMGALYPDDSLLDAVRRLAFDPATKVASDAIAASQEDIRPVLAAVPDMEDTEGVEVLGSVYGTGSPTRELLDKHFGGPQ